MSKMFKQNKCQNGRHYTMDVLMYVCIYIFFFIYIYINIYIYNIYIYIYIYILYIVYIISGTRKIYINRLTETT